MRSRELVATSPNYDGGADAIKNALYGLRASTVEKNDLAMAIRGVAEELASAHTHPSSPAFQVAVEGTPQNLHPILGDEVYSLAAEALRNAFRHAQAHQIEVDFAMMRKISGFAFGTMEGAFIANLSSSGREGHFGFARHAATRQAGWR